MRLTNMTIDNRMKSIGYYQIIGGVVGLILTIYFLIKQAAISGFILFFILIGLFLFSYSIYCGNLLRKLDLKGLSYSIWNQALQVFPFGLLGIGFRYYSGVFFMFGFEWTDSFNPSLKYGISGWAMSYFANKMHEIIFYVNIVPIIILYLIFKTEKEIKERKELMESAAKETIYETDDEHD